MRTHASLGSHRCAARSSREERLSFTSDAFKRTPMHAMEGVIATLVVEKDTDIRKEFVECRAPHLIKEQVHAIHDLRVLQSRAVEPLFGSQNRCGICNTLATCMGIDSVHFLSARAISFISSATARMLNFWPKLSKYDCSVRSVV